MKYGYYIVFIVFLYSPIYSAFPAKDTKVELLEDFSGGLFTSAASYKINKQFSPNMRNVLIDEKPGSIIKRNGYIVSGVTSTLSEVNFMMTYNRENEDAEFIISDSSIVLSTKDFKNYTTVRTGLTTTAILQGTVIRDIAWFTNGVDPVFTWNGTAATILDGSGSTPNVPRGKYIANYQEKIWIFNLAGNNSALRFSRLVSTDGISISPDDLRAWPTELQINIGQGDGDDGTGVKVFSNSLYVFKNKSIYTIYGTKETDYFARKTNANIGTVSQDTIKELDNQLIFLGKDGIYTFNGESSNRISDLVKDDVENIKKDSIRIIENIWNTQSEFAAGQFFGTTATVSGLLQQPTDERG